MRKRGANCTPLHPLILFRNLYHYIGADTTKDADIDTMSASSFLPEKPLFTGLFGLFHVWERFKVRTHLRIFRFRMVVFVCTLKRKRLGVQKRVHSETEHFRVRSGMKKGL